jgi:hypothetical protein
MSGKLSRADALSVLSAGPSLDHAGALLYSAPRRCTVFALRCAVVVLGREAVASACSGFTVLWSSHFALQDALQASLCARTCAQK